MGVIRYNFPKDTDFSKVTDEQIKHVQEKMNNRPMKLLGFMTTKEVHDKMIQNHLQDKVSPLPLESAKKVYIS